MPWDQAFLPNDHACRVLSTFSSTTKYIPCPPITDPLVDPSISENASLTSAKTTNRLHHMRPTESFIRSTMQAVIDHEETFLRNMGLSPAQHDASHVHWAAKKVRGSIDERLQDFISRMPTWNSTKEPVIYTSVDLTTRVDKAPSTSRWYFHPVWLCPSPLLSNLSELGSQIVTYPVNPESRVPTLINRGVTQHLATTLDKDGYLKLLEATVPGILLEASHGCQTLDELATHLSGHDHLNPYVAEASDFEGRWVRIECGKPKQVW